MAARHVNDDREFMQGLFNGLGQALAGVLQQQQETSQAQLQQFLQAQTELGLQNRQLLEAIQQQQQRQQQTQVVPAQHSHAAAINIPFALAPGQAFADAPLDYQTSVGLKLWEQGTKALPSFYDVDPNGTVTFIEELKQQSIAMGWQKHVLTIPVPEPGRLNIINRPLLSHYGLISMDNIQEHALTYVSTEGSRNAQDNMMCYTCIMMSLSEEGRKKITSEPQSYHVDAECTYPSAAMLFKVLMNPALVDNRTTTTMYRNNLAALEIHIGVVNSDIELFNRYVMDNRAALKNRGHDIDEDNMLERILNAYLLAQDNEFHSYITQIKTSIDNGSIQQTAEQLMNKAFNFYKVRKDKGTWGQQSPEHQQIIALSAQFEKLKGGLKLSDQLRSKLKAAVERKKGQAHSRQDVRDKKRQQKNRKNQQATRQRQLDAWKLVEPKPNESKKKTVNGKTFWWCPHHNTNGMWCRHQPTVEECNVLQRKQQDKKINVAQVAIEDEQSDNNSIYSSDTNYLSNNNTIYDELMVIIETEI